MQALTLSNRLRALWGGQGALRHSLTRTAIGSAFLALSSKVLTLLTSIVLARWMGTEGYGVYVTAMAVALLLAVPTGLGLPTLMIRLLVGYRLHRQWELMRGLLVRGNQAVLGVSLTTAAIAVVVVWVLSDRIGVDKSITYALSMLLIPLIALGAMRSSALRGLHHVILGQLPENLIMPGLFLAIIVGLWVMQDGSATLSPQWATLARVVATGTAFGIGVAMLLRCVPGTVRQAASQYEARTWMRGALPLLCIACINVLNGQTDVLMLAALRGSESAGVYQAAVRGAELVAFSLVIVNMAIQPSFARLHAAGDHARLQRLSILGARAATTVALPLTAVMVLWGEPIMAAAFGANFARGGAALAVLSGAQLVNAFTGPANSLLDMTGHENDRLKAMSVGVLANVILNGLLIPRWDILGAAIATGISLILWNTILAILVRRRLGVDATAFGRGYTPGIRSQHEP